MSFTRRRFLRLAGATAAAGFLGFPPLGLAAGPRVVIVGGGIGGATAARYLRILDPAIQVTLVEPKADYHTCFMSNEVLGGLRSIDSIRFGYAGLVDQGVRVLRDSVRAIDPQKRRVETVGGERLDYDRCIVSPGIDFRWDSIQGYDAGVAGRVPHAWQAGAQTALLRRQVEAMEDGGTVIIGAPPNPFRCPPGPYERASLIAHYLQRHKPRSKVLILDAKDKFSKFGLFTAGWRKFYGYGTDQSRIEWVGAADGGTVEALDAASLSVTADGTRHRGAVVNLIPAQQAGRIAFDADLVDESGWCPVDHRSFESQRHPGVHVIGDASIASPMPKSGYAANSQAKVCAAAVAALLRGLDVPQPSYVNTCYSIIHPEHGISVAAVYRLGEDGRIDKSGGGGLTPADAAPEIFQREVAYAHSWFRNITHDVFG